MSEFEHGVRTAINMLQIALDIRDVWLASDDTDEELVRAADSMVNAAFCQLEGIESLGESIRLDVDEDEDS